MRSKIDAMKEVAKMIRTHLEGIVAWAQTRQTNGFLVFRFIKTFTFIQVIWKSKLFHWKRTG